MKTKFKVGDKVTVRFFGKGAPAVVTKVSVNSSDRIIYDVKYRYIDLCEKDQVALIESGILIEDPNQIMKSCNNTARDLRRRK